MLQDPSTRHALPSIARAAERNGPAILQALQEVLPPKGLALEIASGTGQHVALFAAGLPEWNWQPSDAQPDAFESIAQRCRSSGVTNVQAPLVLDVLSRRWPPGADEFTGKFDFIYCANMFHIAPWAACAGLTQMFHLNTPHYSEWL